FANGCRHATPATFIHSGQPRVRAERVGRRGRACGRRSRPFLGEAGSTESSDGFCIAHDTIEVLRRASRALGQRFLDGCTFYGTAEPCPMCSAAVLQGGVSRV